MIHQRSRRTRMTSRSWVPSVEPVSGAEDVSTCAISIWAVASTGSPALQSGCTRAGDNSNGPRSFYGVFTVGLSALLTGPQQPKGARQTQREPQRDDARAPG